MNEYFKDLGLQIAEGCVQDIMAMPLVNNMIRFINQYGNILAIAVVAIFLYGLYTKLK